MGHIERTDKTLPLNEMMFYVRRDASLRERFRTDLQGVCGEFGLSRAEFEALRDRDVRRLHDLGVHQYYVPQILRLFYGAAFNANSHPALEAYKRAYPEETARAMAPAARRAARPPAAPRAER
jgi:protocatechuate 4,5-dioxygenase alpha chain